MSLRAVSQQGIGRIRSYLRKEVSTRMGKGVFDEGGIEVPARWKPANETTATRLEQTPKKREGR